MLGQYCASPWLIPVDLTSARPFLDTHVLVSLIPNAVPEDWQCLLHQPSSSGGCLPDPISLRCTLLNFFLAYIGAPHLILKQVLWAENFLSTSDIALKQFWANPEQLPAVALGGCPLCLSSSSCLACLSIYLLTYCGAGPKLDLARSH